MKPISVNKLFSSGTGVGKNDLRVTGVSIEETIAGIDVSTIIGDGSLVQNALRASDYKYTLNPTVMPGYFYISDKEFYMYNVKTTQFSRAVLSGELVVIQLLAYPDSINSYYEDNEEIVEGGAAPIIIEQFSSGELSNKGVIFDIVINTEDGSPYGFGYRRTLVPLSDGVTYPLISGEPGDYPGYVSPLNRYEKCQEEWYTSNILSEADYYYDISTNSIILSGENNEQFLGKEYAIHWESINEPFSVNGINLNPIEAIPENNILCLSVENIIEEKISSLELEADKTTISKNDEIFLTVTCKSSGENRLSDKTIYCVVDYASNTNGYLVETDSSSSYLSGKEILWSNCELRSNPLEQDTNITSGDIIISGIRHCSEKDGKYSVMSAGLLEDSKGIASQIIMLNTDVNGMAVFKYIPPDAVIGNCVVRITCFTSDMSSKSSIYVNVTGASEYILGKDRIDVIYFSSGEYVSPNIYSHEIPLMFSPSSVEYVSAETFTSGVYNSSQIEWNDTFQYRPITVENGSFTRYAFSSNKFGSSVNFQKSGLSIDIVSESPFSVIKCTDIYERLVMDGLVTHVNI